MIKYWIYYNNVLVFAFLEHLYLVMVSLCIAIFLSSIIVYFMYKKNILLNSMSYFSSIIYSIPSLALFSILTPITGLNKTTAIVVLSFYCQYILIRNFSVGILKIDNSIIEAAIGMGMTENQIFKKIRLPLGIKSILAGIKIASTSTIGIATIASTINAGGIGKILFDGLRTMSVIKILWGIILTTTLCIISNIFLWIIEKIINKLIIK